MSRGYQFDADGENPFCRRILTLLKNRDPETIQVDFDQNQTVRLFDLVLVVDFTLLKSKLERTTHGFTI